MTERHKIPGTDFFKTHLESCWWEVCAEPGPFCRKGLRSPAPTCDQMSFHIKIILPEITTPLFVSTARCKAKSLCKNKSEEPQTLGSGRQAPLPDGRGSESHGSESRTSFC